MLKANPARLPAYDIPSATSIAFSLADHLQWIFASAARLDACTYSIISVDGVPGYIDPEIPPSMAPVQWLRHLREVNYS